MTLQIVRGADTLDKKVVVFARSNALSVLFLVVAGPTTYCWRWLAMTRLLRMRSEMCRIGVAGRVGSTS